MMRSPHGNLLIQVNLSRGNFAYIRVLVRSNPQLVYLLTKVNSYPNVVDFAILRSIPNMLCLNSGLNSSIQST